VLAGIRRLKWLNAADGLRRLLGAPSPRARSLSPERLATALYHGILGREPDPPGLDEQIERLCSGEPLEQVINRFISSAEFHARFLRARLPAVQLPDLTALMPERYETQMVEGRPMNVFLAVADSDIAVMASLIEHHRFYDRFGVWTPVIDLDKEIIAAIVRGLGARSCFELGCFTGPVLSLLADAGLNVCGAEVSHLAFAYAYPNIRGAMMFGDLLSLGIDREFDAVLCMDVLEHLDPLRLDDYVAKSASLLAPNGYLYLNAPMWGEDPVFGTVEQPYLQEWDAIGDAAFWRHWPCDGGGWPLHGHLVWASPGWWTQKLASHGLVRDLTIERVIHRQLGGFFAQARGRRSLFVLRRPANSNAPEAVAAQLDKALAGVPDIPDRPTR
jgi:SAM-dependent methyltransferase